MPEWTPYNDEHPPPKPGEPALHRAARVGDHDAVRRLAEEGADLEEVFDLTLDPDARPSLATPLMVAAGSGDGATAETVRLLVDLGADASAGTPSGSAASFACSGLGWNYKPGGDTERLRLLLELGSPLPPESESAARALCDAASEGDRDRVSVLLAHGVPPNVVWDETKADERRASMAGFLDPDLTGDPIGLTDEDAESFDDSTSGVWDEMADSMSRGPWSHEIPLFCAAESGSAACVRLLLDAGADPTQRDSSHRTAMYSAASDEVARALLDAGIPIEDADRFGWSPLANAVSEGDEGIKAVRALLAAGADPNGTHDRGYTVFMSAVGSERHPEILRLLIANGADPHAVSELGYNAFHAAIDVNGEANDEPSVRDTLGYLAELGVDIELRNRAGQTPLARALLDGNPIDVRVLCELGADPDASCAYVRCGGDSCASAEAHPLIAVLVGSIIQKDGKIGALLDAGADALAKDDEGFSALEHAASMLCDQGDDETLYPRFFGGLRELRFTGDRAPDTRDAFIDAVAPVIHAYVEEFAKPIPVPQTSEYEETWRAELVSSIALLTVYQAWAATERRRRADSAGD